MYVLDDLVHDSYVATETTFTNRVQNDIYTMNQQNYNK